MKTEFQPVNKLLALPAIGRGRAAAVAAVLLLSTSRKWAREWVLVALTTSVLSLQQSENNHGLYLNLKLLIFLSPPRLASVFPLLESSMMLEVESPIRLPRVMLLAWKNDPLDSESRSEESVKEMGDPVGKVLKEIDPGKFRFSSNPTLAFSSLNPKGHPSSCWAITGWDCGGWFDILRNIKGGGISSEHFLIGRAKETIEKALTRLLSYCSDTRGPQTQQKARETFCQSIKEDGESNANLVSR